MSFVSEKFMRAVLPSSLRRSSPARQVAVPPMRPMLLALPLVIARTVRSSRCCAPGSTTANACHLSVPSEREPVQALVVPVVGEHRLDGRNALALQPPPAC